MVHDFVGNLSRTKSGLEYSTEYPVRLDEKNVGFVDVVVWSGGHLFLFDMKSETTDFSRDIQQLKRYALALRHSPAHSWRRIHMCLVYHVSLRERVLDIRNVFGGVDVMLMDDEKEIVTIDGRNLKIEIESARRRFWRLRMALRILSSRSI